jgi:hypothetical protein
MKITRNISSVNPSKCHMIVKGLFGNIKGEVRYADYPIAALCDKNGYFILKNGVMIGAATDFYHACDALLNELKIVTNTYNS